jgi:uncharacterized protein
MPKSTVQEALDYYLSHSSDSEELHLGFYGGEPTLAMDTVRFAVQYLKAGSRGKKLSFGMTTNLADVDDPTLTFLCENRFALVVSLDGPEQVHDRYRVRSDGSGTFKEVMRNLARIRSLDKSYFDLYVTTQTVMAPPIRVDEIIDFFSECELLQGKDTFGFSDMETPEIVFSDKPSEFFSTESVLQSQERFSELARSGELNERHKAPIRRVLNSLYHRDFLHLFRRRRRDTAKMDTISPGGICIPGHRKLCVRCDGTFFPCERIAEIETFRLGSSREGIDVEKAFRLCEEFVGMTPDECRECWAILLCDGVCFRDAYDENGPRPDLKRKACERMRQNKSHGLSRMCSVLETNPNAFDYLNAYVVS